MAGNPRADRYSHTPRKVFDSYIDRMAVKRQRDREDHRADMGALLQKLDQLQDQLTHLEQHVAHHCSTITEEDYDGHVKEDGNEELE